MISLDDVKYHILRQYSDYLSVYGEDVLSLLASRETCTFLATTNVRFILQDNNLERYILSMRQTSRLPDGVVLLIGEKADGQNANDNASVH